MPRIPAVDEKQSGWFTRLIFRYAKRRYGAVPEPVAVSAHHRGLMVASGLHELAFEKAATKLPANVRELAVYRVAQRLGCSWCVDFGTMLQRLEGLDVERLAAIDAYATSPHYSRAERLAIAYADAMTASPVEVTDAQVDELVAEFGRDGVVELSYAIGLENLRARVNSALEITDQGFSDACEIPAEALRTARG